MHDLFLLIGELFLLTSTLECTIWGSAFLIGINPAVCSYTTKETSMVGSAIRKINFYKSIPLPLWDVHCSIPLLDPP